MAFSEALKPNFFEWDAVMNETTPVEQWATLLPGATLIVSAPPKALSLMCSTPSRSMFLRGPRSAALPRVDFTKGLKTTIAIRPQRALRSPENPNATLDTLAHQADDVRSTPDCVGAIMDMVVWLRSLGLEEYEAAFRENKIDETGPPDPDGRRT